MTNRKKPSCWLTILILSGLGLSAGSHEVPSRTREVSRALDPVLSSYEVIRMAPGEIERQVQTTGELRLRFDGVDFYFNLEPHDLRAPNYRAEATGPGGVRRRLPPQPVHTFKGVLAGREEIRGRFNLTGGGVEGVVYAPDGWVYVEPLRNHLPGASPGDLVVYRHSDIKAGEALKCDVSLPGRLQRGVARVAAQTEAVPPINYVADVATEADYEYVQAAGGAEEANREIEGILNVVEEVFQKDLLVQLRLVFQNAWEVEEDPYTGTTGRRLLTELSSYWSEHFKAEQNYDLVYLWTGKQDLEVAGLARGNVCQPWWTDSDWVTALSRRSNSLLGKYATPTHEFGHNFGASHPNEQIPPVLACTDTVMESFGGRLTFCQFSRDEIAAHLAVYNSCLDTQPIRLQPPSGLSATATSESRIQLSWRDNSANETGFKVERRREGSGVWVQIGTTASDTEAYTSEGLFSEAAYLHRVRAFNDTESSAYSNEASATTRASAGVASGWRIDTLAGRTDNDGDGGEAVAARLAYPEAVAVDRSGNLYIADSENHRIRRVDGAGRITTVAGTGERGYGGDGGPAVEARLNYPEDVAVDEAGNLYIADTRNRRIRRVDVAGRITTVAGNGGVGFGEGGGPAVRRSLNYPVGVAVDGAGNLYIADSDQHRIHRVDASGIITTVAGNGEGGFSGDGGPAVRARLASPNGVAVDGAGNLYIADRLNQRIRRVDATGTITTVAGIGWSGYSRNGGPALEVRLRLPSGVAVDGAGNLYIADSWNHRIRRVDKGGTITTAAGIGKSGYSGDGGPAAGAWLHTPEGVAVDKTGNLYIADSGNHRIRRVGATGTITTVAGSGERGYGGDGGPATKTRLYHPAGVAVDNTGNLYIADSWNHRIRQVDKGGTITAVAGTGARGYGGDGGPALEARLNHPTGVAVDGAGNLYIADSENHRIRRVDKGGTITTAAGIGKSGYSGDGGPAAGAWLHTPEGVAVDKTGNLYIADTWNHRIRPMDSSGVLTTIAGTGQGGFGGDGGLAATAQLNYPTGVAVDEAGKVYVADSRNHRIRVLTQLPPPPDAPTRLKATAVSPFRIDLSWRDNSDEEEGFRVQRRMEGSSDWIDIGATTGATTTYSDTGLEPTTSYRYRVHAYRNIVASAFSNEAAATTPRVMPPTLMRFMPTRGPAGVQVNVTGTHFHGATAVEFNGAAAARFEVVSGTRIEAVVPREAASGPIRVVAPGGAVTSAESFTVTDSGIGSRLFVPIVLRGRGRTPGSFFTSELTLTNRGTATAAIHYTYTAAFGGGSGTAVEALGPGRQRVIPDAIAYLTSLGVPIGSGSAGGTLAVEFSNLSSPSAAAVTVRTATPTPEGEGRAGLAYLGVSPKDLLRDPVVIAGLRQNRMDRSNLAVQNAGEAGEGSITLRVTVVSGDPKVPGSLVLPDRTLAPGGFHQYNGILKEAGFDNGYVKVERVSGTAAYYAYGVINDQANSDGSFVLPVEEDSLRGKRGQILPVMVETRDFSSELTVTNVSLVAKTVDFRWVAEAVGTADDTARFSLNLEAGEQRIIPDVVETLRREGVAGIGPARRAYAGAVFATAAEGDMSGIVMGARTGSPGERGQYGVFYHAVPHGAASLDNAWIYGLQQNTSNRSNLALVNVGPFDDSVFGIDIYDGETGALVKTITRTVPPQGWHQINGILGNYALGTRQGYIRIRKVSGGNPFLAYGVINDGGAPGERSGDGAYLPGRE